jgi:hypothetical protein
LKRSAPAFSTAKIVISISTVGYFFAWFNNVDWKILSIMAIVMGERDLSAFNLLVSRMDARTKVRRLKRLCEIKNRAIEQPLAERLKHFEDKYCPLRDRLAHNALGRDEQIPRFHYMQLDRLDRGVVWAVHPGFPFQMPSRVMAVII